VQLFPEQSRLHLTCCSILDLSLTSAILIHISRSTIKLNIVEEVRGPEVFKILLKLVILVQFGIFDVSRQVEHGQDWSIDWDDDEHVEEKTKYYVTGEVVHEHVVGDMDLVLSGHEIEERHHRYAIVHAN
jgi:hypothetical protein